MSRDLFADRVGGDTLLRKQRCAWCSRSGIYNDGTKCAHGAPVQCVTHGRWADLNLVARGRRAAVKCAHYGNAFVVLWCDPIADTDEYGTYTIQFAMQGVGSELYTIPHGRLTCPHYVFDSLVRDMRSGARPSANRVPPPETNVATPGESLDDR